jgi:hypothetical protein
MANSSYYENDSERRDANINPNYVTMREVKADLKAQCRERNGILSVLDCARNELFRAVEKPAEAAESRRLVEARFIPSESYREPVERERDTLDFPIEPGSSLLQSVLAQVEMRERRKQAHEARIARLWAGEKWSKRPLRAAANSR